MPDGSLIESERPSLSRSLWTDTATPRPETPPFTGPDETDVAIVGGGFTGLSAALHLAEAGRAVTLLDSHHPGWGASGRNGGQVIAGLKEDPEVVLRRFGAALGGRLNRLSGEAPGLVFDLCARFGIDCGASRTGWIQPAQDAAARKVQEARVRQWQPWSEEISLLSARETADLLGAEGYHSGLIDRRSGAVQPLSYAFGLARAALSLGAVLHGSTEVTGLARDGAGWRVTTARGVLKARCVILATNGYSGPVQDRLRRSVVPVVSTQIATHPLPANLRGNILPEGQVVSDLYRLLVYYRLDAQNRFVIGGRGAYSEAQMPGRLETLKRKAVALYPQLAGLDWPYHWGGYVAMTRDHLPHLHEIEPGLHAGLGYNGRGVAMATAMGRELARRVSGTPANALDVPTTAVTPIPFHMLRKPIVTALATWYALRDRFA
ncbi:FAD-binding oxidoreductase (plasmid) [Paroceanicella profunda]|uniref:FAD-binding oxidoreductase n=2 Tax=Paroceanicella profunda TaxID=2579971 RepID=A0A5B8G2H3_9RHOB|nr:FAD-binding oxidoreductase [Paroceanicella profunda]